MLSEPNSIRLCKNKIKIKQEENVIFQQQPKKSYVREERQEQKKQQTRWLVLYLGITVFSYIHMVVCSSNHCRVAKWKFFSFALYIAMSFLYFFIHVYFFDVCKEHLCSFRNEQSRELFFWFWFVFDFKMAASFFQLLRE